MRLFEPVLRVVLGRRAEPPAGVEVPEGVVVRRGALIPTLGGWLVGAGAPAAAVALRRTIVLHPRTRATPRLLAHELTHIEQWRRERLFPLRYVWKTLRHGYRENPYELEARQVAASLNEPNPQGELS